MHCSMSFHIGDLSIRRFWCPQGSSNQSPADSEGQLKFSGNQQLNVGFQLHGELALYI